MILDEHRAAVKNKNNADLLLVYMFNESKYSHIN
jgi:hypothetical protein